MFGCSDPKPPLGGYIRRQGDRVVISCESTATQWEIVCRDGQWHGDYEQCAESKEPVAYVHQYAEDKYRYLYTTTCGLISAYFLLLFQMHLILLCCFWFKNSVVHRRFSGCPSNFID